MRALEPAALLWAWEQGQEQDPAVRALALLAAASPEAAWEELGALPLGERDGRLLALREATLGCRLEGLARCPGCGERVDVPLDTRELRAGVEAAPAAPLQLTLDGLELRFRLPNSLDLMAAGRCAGVDEARRLLAERCLVEARRNASPVGAGELAEEEVTALAEGLAAADPGAELLLDLCCPACGHGWRERLDVASFFWAELEIHTPRLLREVHALARAYGWREADVLSLSPRRRRLYLEMVGGA